MKHGTDEQQVGGHAQNAERRAVGDRVHHAGAAGGSLKVVVMLPHGEWAAHLPIPKPAWRIESDDDRDPRGAGKAGKRKDREGKRDLRPFTQGNIRGHEPRPGPRRRDPNEIRGIAEKRKHRGGWSGRERFKVKGRHISSFYEQGYSK